MDASHALHPGLHASMRTTLPRSLVRVRGAPFTQRFASAVGKSGTAFASIEPPYAVLLPVGPSTSGRAANAAAPRAATETRTTVSHFFMGQEDTAKEPRRLRRPEHERSGQKPPA